MDTFEAPNPYMNGDAKLRYVGMSSFGQKRQVSVPLVVNVYQDGEFETLFVAVVDLYFLPAFGPVLSRASLGQIGPGFF
jgi:hypothetical protein